MVSISVDRPLLIRMDFASVLIPLGQLVVVPSAGPFSVVVLRVVAGSSHVLYLVIVSLRVFIPLSDSCDTCSLCGRSRPACGRGKVRTGLWRKTTRKERAVVTRTK